MASFEAARPHAHLARALKARATEQAPSAIVSTTATALSESTIAPTPSAAAVASIPHNVPALIAVISVLIVIILGLVGWRVWAWRVRKRAQHDGTHNEKQRNSTSKGSLFGWSDDREASRPHTVVLNVPAPVPEATWVPQVRPWAPVRRATDPLAPAPAAIMITPAPEVTTPPPAYLPGNGAQSGALALKSTWEADTPLTPSAAQSLASPPPASPARTSSFAHQQAASHVRRSSSASSTGSAADRDPRRLPRSMAVAQTFAPSMADELTIAVGEKVRMLEEYADGWCLAERGQARGVVPRFCLAERDRRSRTVSTRTAGSPPTTASLNRI